MKNHRDRGVRLGKEIAGCVKRERQIKMLNQRSQRSQRVLEV